MANTVENSLAICGVNADNNNMIFNGATVAARIADEVFDNNFDTFLDITFSELDDTWRTYAQLTLAEGRLRLRPATKSNVRALAQWVRDCLRTDVSPANLIFPIANKATLINNYNTHKQWTEDSSGMLKSAFRKPFKEEMKWIDWKSSLISFLRTQPGRSKVPLSYVIRDNDLPIHRENPDFMDDYIDRASLTGNAFNVDKTKVHAFIMRLISENPVAEQKVLPYKDAANGRLDFTALKEFYEGVGANSKAVLQAERDLQSLFYLGEKKPHMWWDEFEVRLTNAFAILDKDAGRQVHTDDMKLRMLNSKIRADFLHNMKTNVQMEMNKTPTTMTYASALANYRNAVNEKFPSDPSAHSRKRRINAARSGPSPTIGRNSSTSRKIII